MRHPARRDAILFANRIITQSRKILAILALQILHANPIASSAMNHEETEIAHLNHIRLHLVRAWAQRRGAALLAIDSDCRSRSRLEHRLPAVILDDTHLRRTARQLDLTVRGGAHRVR